MLKAVLIFLLVLVIIIGGMMTLLQTARKIKLPKNYDKSKSGWDDEEDDW